LAEDLFSDINRAADMSSLSDLERKHLPVIDAPDSVKAGEPFEVTVEVGRLLTHPNEPGHHIEWIVLLNGSVTLAMVELSGVSAEPKITLTVRLERSSRLRALAKCNLHGEWEQSRDVKVS